MSDKTISFEEFEDINQILQTKNRKIYSNEEIKYIVEHSSIEDVVNFYNIEYKVQNNGELLLFCPFHNDTGNPNLFINIQKKVFFCFSCGEKGNIIDFISKINHNSKLSESVKILSQISGLENLSQDDLINNRIDSLEEDIEDRIQICGMSPEIFNITISSMCGEYLIKNPQVIDEIEKIYKYVDENLKKEQHSKLQKLFTKLPKYLKNLRNKYERSNSKN